MDYHCYANDTQIYIVVEPRDNLSDMSMKLKRLASPTYVNGCVQFNLCWTRTKPNLWILLQNTERRNWQILAFHLVWQHYTRYTDVKNLGVYFDRTLSMEKQCNAIARSCYFHIRNIGCIRPFISEDACNMLLNALVTSRLDYGNALLYGIAKNLTDKLQRVHNTAARLITRTRKMDHITPVLICFQ